MIVKPIILLIKAYQQISKITPNTCRFYPSCSEYSIEVFNKYGLLKGLYFSIKRILKCHPGHPGGYDPA
jgi:uncharacterized protein